MKIKPSILIIIFFVLSLAGCRLEGNVSEDGTEFRAILE